jgi:hypothetical protein
MAGPWEKYAAQGRAQADEGPWTKYQDAAAPSESTSALRGAIHGYTAGLDDEITGAVGAAGRLAGYKNLGSFKPFDPNSHLERADTPLSMDEIANAYRENRDFIRNEQKQDLAINPKATITGNVAGAIFSPAAKLKVGGAGLKGAMATSGLQGAVYGAGGSDADLTKGEVGQFVKDTLSNAVIGTAIPVGMRGVQLASKGAASLAGAAFRNTFGISKPVLEKYLANPQAINAATSVEEIKNAVDEAATKITGDLENAKITRGQATEALGALKQQVTQGLGDAKGDAKDALRAAEASLKDASDRVLAPLRAKTAPTDRAGDVVEMVGKLKDQVSQGSGKAYNVLEGAKEGVNLSPVYSQIDDAIAKYSTYGTDEASAVADKLKAYKERLMDQYKDGNIPAPLAKRLIQGVDQITTYSPAAGSFDKASGEAFKGVRKAIDSTLKDSVPAYRAEMEALSPQARLLEDANKAFGTPESAVSRLGRMNTPRGELDRTMLARLEQATSQPGAVTGAVDEFAKTQSLLRDPQALEQVKRALPEYAAYRQAAADVARRNPQWTREQIATAMAKSKEARALSLAESNLADAQAKAAPFHGLNENTSENKIRSLMKGDDRNFAVRDQLSKLGKAAGRDFVQDIDNLAIKEAFNKGQMNGSRNTIFWGIAGSVFGGVGMGTVTGATFGHQVMDKYGPKVGKMIIDVGLKLRDNPSAQVIRNSGLPEVVKTEMERDIRNYIILKHAAGDAGSGLQNVADSAPDADRAPARGEDKWAQDGASKLGLSADDTQQISQNKELKRLLIEASDMPVGSPALKRIKDQIQKGMVRK